MFVMDTPPDVPPQYAPVVIAQTSQTKPADTSTDRAIGVCQLIENQEASKYSAVNGFGPLGAAWVYLKKYEEREVELTGTVKVLSSPTHGTLEKDGGSWSYQYIPVDPNYVGQDKATFLVEIGGYKVKVMYFFNVKPGVGGGTEGSNPYDNPENCPNGPVWRISLNEST